MILYFYFYIIIINLIDFNPFSFQKYLFAELLNSQNLLKEYITKLERSLASKESSAHQMNSASNDELNSRDSEVEDLKEKLRILEGSFSAEQNQLKEAKKSVS